jgi:hypothetical protein
MIGLGLGCALLTLEWLAPSTTAQDPALTPPEQKPAGTAHAEQPERWELGSSLFYSNPPGPDDDRTTLILYADRGPLHLEGRYGYEDENTGSVWLGWTMRSEGEVSTSITPMAGVVFGDTDGFAPGVELGVGWKKLQWYVEAEYLFDSNDSDDNFFYSWSTLTWGFTPWLRAGVVGERTKQIDTDYELQHGLVIELAFKRLTAAIYTYNIATDDSYTVLSVGFGL